MLDGPTEQESARLAEHLARILGGPDLHHPGARTTVDVENRSATSSFNPAGKRTRDDRFVSASARCASTSPAKARAHRSGSMFASDRIAPVHPSGPAYDRRAAEPV